MAESKSSELFDELVVDDAEYLFGVGEACLPIIYDTVRIKLGHAKVPIAMYITAFDCIIDYLRSMQKERDEFNIIIANRLKIGYTTTEDASNDPLIDDMEKIGNYMIHMSHIENNSKTEIDENEKRSVVRCTQWNEANGTTSIGAIGAITKAAVRKWDEVLDIRSVNPEVVMPVFCIVHEKIVEMTVMKRQLSGAFEERVNVGGCYELFVRMMEDGLDISFKPTIYDKVTLKDDKRASSRYE